MIAMSSTRVTNVNDGQDGAQGAQGPQGVSVTNVVPEYRLSNSSTELTGSGTGYTWSETKPQVTGSTYLWSRNRNEFSNNTTNYSDAVCDITTTNVVFNVDQLNNEISSKVEQSDINTAINTYDNNTVSTIRTQVANHTTAIGSITSRVSSVETTTGSLGTRMTAAETQIQQTEDTIDLLASVTTDGQTQTSTVTLTPEMVTAMTRQFVVKDPEGSETIISGGQIHTDAIKSTNYVEPTTNDAKTVSGNLIAFTDGSANKVNAFKVYVTPIQTGTPSPSNVCPINTVFDGYIYKAGKNILPLLNTFSSVNGISAVKNTDGTITVTGTATNLADVIIASDLELPEGNYKLSGGVSNLNRSDDTLYIAISSGQTTRYVSCNSGDVSFTLQNNEQITSVFIRISSGITANNIVFSPMIRSSVFEDNTFEAYKGKKIKTEDILTYDGIKNLMDGYETSYVYQPHSANWIKDVGNNSDIIRFYTETAPSHIKKPSSNNEVADILCSIGKKASENDGYYGRVDNAITVNTDGIISFYSSSDEAKNATNANTFMRSKTVVYQLEEPYTSEVFYTGEQPDRSEFQQIFDGNNTIWANERVEVSYGSNGTAPYSVDGTFLDLENGNITSPNFVVDTENSIAYFNGEIVSDAGTIGGWKISDDEIYSDYTQNSLNYKLFLKNYNAESTSGLNTPIIGFERKNSSGTVFSPFYVTRSGELHAEGANITGTINTGDGTIGGWNISKIELSSGVTVGDTTYSVFLKKYDDGTIFTEVSNSDNLDVQYTSEGVFEITPTANGSGYFRITYDLDEYPTKRISIYDSEFSNLLFYNNGYEYSVVATAQDNGWKTVNVNSDMSGLLIITLSYNNLNTSDGMHEAIIKIIDKEGNEKLIVANEEVAPESLNIKTIGISEETNGVITYPFSVDRKGKLHAEDAEITGTINATNGSFNGAITAQSGTIGGFTIVQDDTAGTTETTANDGHAYKTALYVHNTATVDGTTYEYETGLKGSIGNATDAAFYVRQIVQGDTWDNSSLNFYVRNNGYLYANNANITGNITAQGGTIGGFNIKKGDSGCAAKTSANGGHAYPNSLYVHNADDTYEYETGIKGETSSSNPNTLAFYVTRITKGGDWQYPSNGGTRTDIFKIGHGGTLYCSNADITGKITATSGSFKGDVTASTLTAKNTLYLHNSSGTKKVAITAPDSSFGTSLSIGTGFSALYLAKQTVIGGSLMVYEDGTGPLTCGSITCDKVNIDSVSVTINNTTAKRQGRFTCSDAGNVGLWDVTHQNWIIVSNSDLEVHIPREFYACGLADTTQRPFIGSSAVKNQGMAWLGGTATSTLSIRGQWNASSWATKTVAVSSSDIRLKKDITDSQVDALEVINRVKLREFTWKDDGVRQKIGVIVDELEELDPLLSVGGGEDENGEPIYKSVNNLLMISYLTKAAQQLSAQVDSLQNEIKELKGDK